MKYIILGRRERTILAWNVRTGFERSLVEMFSNCDAFGSVMLSGQIPITKTMLYGMAVSYGTCNGHSLASAGIFYPESPQYVCEMLQHQTRNNFRWTRLPNMMMGRVGFA